MCIRDSGKTQAFEVLRTRTGDVTILIMLVTSGLSHLPPMKVVTILSGPVSYTHLDVYKRQPYSVSLLASP